MSRKLTVAKRPASRTERCLAPVLKPKKTVLKLPADLKEEQRGMRARVRAAQLQAAATATQSTMSARKGERSYLEQRSLTPAATNRYLECLRTFRAWHCKCGKPVLAPAEVDIFGVDFMDTLFLDGRGVNSGEYLIAALEWQNPCHKRTGAHPLERMRRALKGWRKAAPPGSRLPLPKLIISGVIQMLMAQNRMHMAIFMGLGFCSYMRPSELLGMTAKDVVKPVARAGPHFAFASIIVRPREGCEPREGEIPDKVGVFDNTLVLNKGWEPALGRRLLEMVRGHSPSQKVFTFSMMEATAALRECCQRLGLDAEEISLYQLRHGGAAEDLMTTRSFEEVKARGRWSSSDSVKRYTKTGKLQKLVSELAPRAL
eukprot:6477718-Amphidinium_carterae.2